MRLTVLRFQRIDLQGKENPPGVTDEEVPEKGGKLRGLRLINKVNGPTRRF